MAAPHTAGAAALVRQANPSWTPSQVRAALMNTASGAASVLTNANPRLAGAGRRPGRPGGDLRRAGDRSEPLVRL